MVMRAEIDRIWGRWPLHKDGDLKPSGPPHSQDADSGARTRGKRVPANLKADSLSTEPPTPGTTLVQDNRHLSTSCTNTEYTNYLNSLLETRGNKRSTGTTRPTTIIP
ncbi:hypothetical protein PoB_001548300 [Plakobranchus ocellatus]|uniref:Uncharacterized protein n=1 Tax=Plakobranchus ocellatus TaxID=259542 RepID=A0AAV3Z320_9GAST|nr:hypothetical protein PoB_001548300 [Plakobranchus ocellatus]